MHEHVNPRKTSSSHLSLPTGQPKHAAQTQSRAHNSYATKKPMMHMHITIPAAVPPQQSRHPKAQLCRAWAAWRQTTTQLITQRLRW
jgi:hypothetical protein